MLVVQINLIGRGDMLYTQGNDMIRIQCAFVDTPEVEKIVDFIGNQKAYPDAYLLPEYVGEESGTNIDIDIADRDKLFREACRNYCYSTTRFCFIITT